MVFVSSGIRKIDCLAWLVSKTGNRRVVLGMDIKDGGVNDVKKYDDIINATTQLFNCRNCSHCAGDLCNHSGSLTPIPMIQKCPVSGKLAAPTKRERRKIDRLDRTGRGRS
jgi:hypothetical protein